MKKTNILKIALTLVLAFAFSSTFAQILIDYEDVAEVSYQTTGQTFRIYVEPDLAYNPSWVAATNAGIDADARWTWTYPGGLVTGTPATGAPANQNWVEFVGPTVGGPYSVTVAESNQATGCTGAASAAQDITVLAAPTADIAGSSGANVWNVTLADHDYDICGDALAENITVTLTETGVPAILASYAYYVQVRIVILQPDDTEEDVVSTTAFLNRTIAAKQATGTADGGTDVLTTGAMPVLTYDWGLGATDSRTMYEFTILKPSDAAVAAGNGVVSAISHKSDWLTLDGGGDVTTYPFADLANVTVVYVVNPTPTTGPIYTIPNAQFF